MNFGVPLFLETPTFVPLKISQNPTGTARILTLTIHFQGVRKLVSGRVLSRTDLYGFEFSWLIFTDSTMGFITNLNNHHLG